MNCPKDYSHAYFDTALLVSPASEYLNCHICFNLMEKPLQCPHCGNSYCSACISEVLTKSGECPTCRQSLSSSQLVVNRALLGAINDLSIRCPTTLDTNTTPTTAATATSSTDHATSERMTCSWEGCIKDVGTHLSTCSHVITIPVTTPPPLDTDLDSFMDVELCDLSRDQEDEDDEKGGVTSSVLTHEELNSTTQSESIVRTDIVTLDLSLLSTSVDDSSGDQKKMIPGIPTTTTSTRYPENLQSTLSVSDVKMKTLSAELKMKLHVHVDVLMETCPHNVLELATRHLRNIVDYIMENHVVGEGLSHGMSDRGNNRDTGMILADFFEVMSMFDSLLVLIAEMVNDSATLNTTNASECISHWTKFINTVMAVDVHCLHDLVQQLIEVCANLSDVADAISLEPKSRQKKSGDTPIADEGSTDTDTVGREKSDENKREDSPLPPPSPPPPAPPIPKPSSTATLTTTSTTSTSSTSTSSTSTLSTSLSIVPSTPLVSSRWVISDEVSALLPSCPSPCPTTSHLPPPPTCTQSESIIPESLTLRHNEEVDILAIPSSLPANRDGEDELEEIESYENIDEGELEDWEEEEVEDEKEEKCVPEVERKESSSSSESAVLVMTVKELSERMELSVEDTVFLLLEAEENMVTAAGLMAVREELSANALTHNSELSAECVLELSLTGIDTFFREVQKGLDSLTDICTEGGLDADVCFLSDCIRSNGIYVVDWRGDSFVLKADRQDVCQMLGMDYTASTHQTSVISDQGKQLEGNEEEIQDCQEENCDGDGSEDITASMTSLSLALPPANEKRTHNESNHIHFDDLGNENALACQGIQLVEDMDAIHISKSVSFGSSSSNITPSGVSDSEKEDRAQAQPQLNQNQHPSAISVNNVKSVLMTVKELSILMEFSVSDTVFLLLEADKSMLAALGLTAAQEQLEANVLNHQEEQSADCLVELSSEAIAALIDEVQKHLDSLTFICTEGGLDADVCFLSDCIRSNGIYVVDWRGDSFVLKADRQDVCQMLGMDYTASTHQTSVTSDQGKQLDGGESGNVGDQWCDQKVDGVSFDTAPLSDSGSFYATTSSGSISSTKPPLYNVPASFSTFNSDTALDTNSYEEESEYFSEFPPNSPALTHVPSSEMQDMIQSGFNSTWDTSITNYITLQDLAYQWKLNILSIICFAERRIIPVLSPSLEPFSPEMSGEVTHDWLVRNEELSEVLSATQKTLFNILHLTDMFENIADISLVLSKAQITVITWDEEKYILQSDMEAAMEVCINFES